MVPKLMHKKKATKSWSKMMCEILGHKLPTGYCGSRPYLRVGNNIITDGIGRRHASLYAFCDRCQEEYHVASIHLPNTDPEKEL